MVKKLLYKIPPVKRWKIRKILKEIDSNPYRHLKERGIKGTPKNAETCPVANLLRKECGGNIRVGSLSVRTHPLDVKKIEMPHSVRRFVYEFDQYRYPDLRQ